MSAQKLCDYVAKTLPSGWRVSILIDGEGDCGGYSVELIDPSGDISVDFPSNHENLDQEILDAVKHCVKMDCHYDKL